MKPDMPAAEYVRQVERKAVQRVDDRIDAGHNGGDHPVDEADDAIDGGFDGVRHLIPDGVDCVADGLPGSIPVAAEHGA